MSGRKLLQFIKGHPISYVKINWYNKESNAILFNISPYYLLSGN